MDYKIKGTVVSVGETKEYGSNGFKKREVVVDTAKNPQYPCPVPLTFKKDDCAKADALSVGDVIEVEGWIEGRKWDGPNGVRYFTDLAAKSVIVEKKSETAADDPKAVRDWETLLAFAKGRGMGDKAAVQNVCRAYCKKYGVEYKDFATSNWVALAGAVEDALKVEEAKAMDEVQEEMPF